jgi:hypothetical protein
MASKLTDVVEGFNAYLDGLAKEDKVDYLFSLTLFDTQVAYRDVAVPLSNIRKLDKKTYVPGGNTALNDAIGITVRKVDADRPQVDKVVTVIMTDGEENSSREWTHDAVKALISQKESEGTWTFVFLGAAPDAWDQGRGYGIPVPNVVQYDPRSRRQLATSVRQPLFLAVKSCPRESRSSSGVRQKLTSLVVRACERSHAPWFSQVGRTHSIV